MAKNVLFTFDDLAKGRASKTLQGFFTRAGAQLVDTDYGTTVKRTAGISYREMSMTFADSQVVLFRVKQTGDIYQLLLNGRVLPLKNPDDHKAAIDEVVKAMNAGRAAFQKKLANAKVALPPSIRTAAPKLEKVLTEKRDQIKEAIATTRDEAAKIRAQIVAS